MVLKPWITSNPKIKRDSGARFLNGDPLQLPGFSSSCHIQEGSRSSRTDDAPLLLVDRWLSAGACTPSSRVLHELPDLFLECESGKDGIDRAFDPAG